MSLRATVTVPFRQHGQRTLRRNEFVVALSMDRDWFTPDQIERLVDVAVESGVLTVADDELTLELDPADVTVPDGFTPDEDILQTQSIFEQVLDALVAEGMEKRAAVGRINAVQAELEVTIEAAAVVTARREGLDAAEFAPAAREALR